MSELITYRGAVYPWHCDHMGHMNVMWYVGKFDEATWQLFSKAGLTPAFMRAQQRGVAAVEQHIAYKRELVAGDVITIRSAIVEIKDKAVRFSHEMRNDHSEEVAATTVLTAVFMDTVARKTCAFPDDIRAKITALIAGDNG